MRPGNAALGSLALLALLLLGPYGCATSGAEFWYNRGVRAHHNLDNKISHFTKAIELNPKYLAAYLERGVAYAKKGLNDKAIIDYSKVIELKPDYAIPYYNRGLAYKLKGQNDRAIVNYNKAIELNPDYASAYHNRGSAYVAKGLHDPAIRDYTEAIRLLKMEADKNRLGLAYINRGGSYRVRGSYDRAIADLNKAIELKPNYGHAYIHLAWVFATSPSAVFRNGKRAVELAEKAVELDRKADYLDILAAAYAEVGRFEEAISTQLLAIDLSKKGVDESYAVKFDRHLERYKSNKPWRMSEPKGGTGHPATDTKLNTLAELYRTQGKFAEAEPLYKRALAIREKALGPQHQDVATSLNNLAELYRAQGKETEANPLFKRSLAIRETARQQEEARKQERQQKLEALSGRYATAGGRSLWDIRFHGNRFEARYLFKGKWRLLYDGKLTGTRITGRAHLGLSSFCRQSPTPPLYGSIDLRRKSFEISWADYNLVEMRRYKRCVPETARRIWQQAERQ